MKSVTAIAFDYRPSRWLVAAVGTMALLACVATLASGIGVALQAVAIALAAAYAAAALHRLRRPVVTRCAWHSGGEWRVRDARGEEHVATLLHAAARGPLIVLVLFAGPLRRIALVLLPDNSDAELRRLLRVRLARPEASSNEQGS